MDHFRVRRAHFMGMCGGAIVALAAAARSPERVSSLSVWHGDFDLGDTCPKTNHQRDLQALMSMATERRVSPRDIHVVLCRSMLANVPEDLAPLVLYPYATPELLFAYCKLNGNIMQTNAAQYLPLIVQPALVVTSEDDLTAHPAGSKHVAAALPHVTLQVESHGNHISLFRGMANLQQMAADFIAGAES
jgi:pimeloyl-ACP methyl ester carboxylesterase